MRELPKRIPVSVGNEKLSNFASNWVSKNSPKGLIEFCLEKVTSCKYTLVQLRIFISLGEKQK